MDNMIEAMKVVTISDSLFFSFLNNDFFFLLLQTSFENPQKKISFLYAVHVFNFISSSSFRPFGLQKNPPKGFNEYSF